MSADDRKKFGTAPTVLDAIDRRILTVLQRDAKASLAAIGEHAQLSAPAVIERIRKLERAGVIRGYHAVLDGRRIGLDVTAFIGVSINYPKMIGTFEQEAQKIEGVLEIHHVTGAHSLLLKVKTWNTASLEQLISRLRSIPDVQRTETMVVFSTRVERTELPLERDDGSIRPPARARGRKSKPVTDGE